MRIPADGEIQQMVVRHSLGWLVAANCVGVLLAMLLVFPELGTALGELTYGRWAALHLNWQLYGWCSLPLVGLLFHHFLTPKNPARLALRGWSLALLIGGLSWLAGDTTGKLFLDWTGPAKVVLVLAQVLLWLVLAANWRRTISCWKTTGDILLLTILAAVPALLWWSATRKVYPPIDPGTGGPTGASLLGSTLGIVLIFWLVPKFLRLKNHSRFASFAHGIYFGFSSLIYALINHKNSSHHEWQQLAGLGTLLGWIPLSTLYLRSFDWNKNSRIWLYATLVWWSLLVTTGFAEFYPGILDRVKFTHGLVAHAHLAMAGFLSSLNMLILCNLGSSSHLSLRIPFALWQIGLVFHLTALAAIGSFEVSDPGWLLQRGSLAVGLFSVRLGAGMLMAAVSIKWLLESEPA